MNRRDFLKLLGVTGAAAALPIAPASASTPLSPAVDDAIVDAPITAALPLGWISVDGKRYQMRDVSMEWCNVFSDDWSSHPRQYCKWAVSIDGEIDYQLAFRQEAVDLAVSVPGLSTTLKGKGRISNLSMWASAYGRGSDLELLVTGKMSM